MALGRERRHGGRLSRARFHALTLPPSRPETRLVPSTGKLAPEDEIRIFLRTGDHSDPRFASWRGQNERHPRVPGRSSSSSCPRTSSTSCVRSSGSTRPGRGEPLPTLRRRGPLGQDAPHALGLSSGGRACVSLSYFGESSRFGDWSSTSGPRAPRHEAARRRAQRGSRSWARFRWGGSSRLGCGQPPV